MALWTPEQLGTAVVGWWDAAETSTVELYPAGDQYAGRVKAWSSRVGGFAASYPGNKSGPPYYGATQRNGRPAVYVPVNSNGEGYLTYPLPATYPLGNAPSSMIALAFDGGSNDYRAVGGYGAAATGRLRQLYRNNRNQWGSTVYAGDADTSRSPANGKDAIIYGSFTPTIVQAVVDGQFEASRGGNYLGPMAGDLGQLMGTHDPSVQVVQEFAIFSRALTVEERQQVEGYLAHKWGVQALLPASHPYSAAAPTTAATGISFTAAGASYATTMTAAHLLRGARLVAGSAGCRMNGQAVSLRIIKALRLSADVGGYGASFQAPQLLHGHVMSAASGRLLLSSSAGSLLAGRRLPAGAGSITLTAPAVALNRVGRLALAAGSGALAIVAPATGLRLARRIAAGGYAGRLGVAAAALSINGAAVPLPLPPRARWAIAGAPTRAAVAIALPRTAFARI